LKNYELLTVFKPNLDVEEVEKAIAKIEENVSGFAGKILNVEKIGRKRLAYDILKFRDGFFTTFMLNIPAEKITEFKRQLKLTDSILRVMFVEIAKTKVATK
jgi:small subunit ribosomal protein S6